MKKKIFQSFIRRYSSSFEGPDQVLPAADFRAWLPEQPVNLRIQAAGPQSAAPVSIPSLLRQTAESLPNHPALGIKGKDGNNILWTYSNYLEDVLTVSKGFIALGLEPFHSVCILGQNTPEWVISSLAAVHARGIATGIYQTNSAEACEYVARHSRANIIVLDSEAQLNKILAIKHKLPSLKAIVQYSATTRTEGVVSWEQLIRLGKAESESDLNSRLKQTAVNQCALLVYTSGTTGNPKGAMLSHDAVVLNARESTLKYYNWRFGKERIVSYLPLSHVAGTMMDIYYSMATGSTTYFADANALKGSLVQNLHHFKPTRFLGMPRVWEKMEESIKLAGRNNTGIKKWIADWAKGVALSHHLARDAGSDRSSLQYRVASKLVLAKVHKALGLDEVNDLEMATGGAATPAETTKYFLSLNMRLFDIYGSTESVGAPQSTGMPGPGGCRIGTVGREPTGLLETRILETGADGSGEICSRGRSMFMGYLFDKERTLQTIDEEGWVHSGDICTQDQDGFFKIIGRSKEIIITSGGENIAPVNLEDEIKRSLPNIISNVMVVGDQRKFLTCLLTLKVEVDPETMLPSNKLDGTGREVMEQLGLDNVLTVEDVISRQDAGFKKYIDEGIARANMKAISSAAKVQRWRVLPREFSVQSGELSPSLKLKRFYVIELYKNTIDEMYN